MTLPTFEETDAALRRARVLVDAAECHGALAGLLSGGKPTLKQRWLEQTLEDTDPADAGVRDCRRLLEQLWNETQEALAGQEFSFEPLLPSSEAGLGDRVEALSGWCDGFMYGLGLAEIESFDRLPPDVAEVLRDFADIGRGGLALGNDAEEDEQAYAELSEYLRVGTQLVHDELNPPQKMHRAPPNVH